MTAKLNKSLAKAKAKALAAQAAPPLEQSAALPMSGGEPLLALPGNSGAAGNPFVWNLSLCDADARAMTKCTSSVDSLLDHLQNNYLQTVSKEEAALSMWPLAESNILAALLSRSAEASR